LYNKLAARPLVFTAFAVFLCGCAVDGGMREDGTTPPPSSLTAAELGLPPALRPFHDELEPYGDWILVEPQGWVFRPRVNSVAWRPYQDGHWEPSYSYGWIWESNDPFGWLTDHYGFWFHDSFQGWVWQPYGAWAPSWVAWVGVGNYVGWAPLPPSGVADYDQVPGGVFTYVNARTLGTPIGSRASFVSDIPDDQGGVQPIDRIASLHGVYWNAGPDPDVIMGLGTEERLRADEREGRVTVPAPTKGIVGEVDLDLHLLETRTTRAWGEARRELLAMRARRAGVGRDQDRPTPTEPAPPPTPRPAPLGPRIKPAPTPVDTAADTSTALSRIKNAAKPGAPRPPRRPPH
jgi:hypothetical protein